MDFADLQHARLQFLHFCHGFVRAIGKREEGQLDEHGNQQNGNAVIAEEA